MNDYIFDANHLSPLVTLGHPLRNQVLTMLEEGQTFVVASVALNEFLFGIGTITRAKQNLQEWELIRSGFDIYEVDEGIAEKSAKLRIRSSE